MRPVSHAIVSGAVGAGVWAATGSPGAGGVALGVGVLMDLDHLYDFYQWYVQGRPNRIYLLLHAWEYSAVGVVVLASVFFHPLLLAAVLAHLVHVASDHLHNRLSPFGYFMTFRVIKGCETAFIAPRHNVMGSYRGWPRLLPFGWRLQPWYRRRIEPWFEERVKRVAHAQDSGLQSDD